MNERMHICISGPIAGEDVRHLLDAGTQVPAGYVGAPLMGVLVDELLARGHRVTGVTTDPCLPTAGGPVRVKGPNFELVALAQRPHAWRFNGFQLGRALDLFAVERHAMAREMRRVGPDIVHAHWSYEFALAALDAGLPHVITCHDSPAVVWRHTRSPYRLMRWLMAHEVFQRGRCFTTVSAYMAHQLAPALATPPAVIPNPVARRAFTLGQLRLSAASRRVAMVCNGWGRIKNAQRALEAFALFRQHEPFAELHLYGADFGAGEVAQRWAHDRAISAGMYFHGDTPHADLLDALARMNVLLHPSLEESFGVVLAEAMAVGLPVVGGRTSGAVPELLGADSGTCAPGVLTDVSSPERIAEALLEVFDADYSRRSAAALERAQQRYSINNIASKYETAYRRALMQGQATTENAGPVLDVG